MQAADEVPMKGESQEQAKRLIPVLRRDAQHASWGWGSVKSCKTRNSCSEATAKDCKNCGMQTEWKDGKDERSYKVVQGREVSSA